MPDAERIRSILRIRTDIAYRNNLFAILNKRHVDLCRVLTPYGGTYLAVGVLQGQIIMLAASAQAGYLTLNNKAMQIEIVAQLLGDVFIYLSYGYRFHVPSLREALCRLRYRRTVLRHQTLYPIF